MGLVHIYCGDGKGKTSAAIGLAVRAAGSGRRVVIARFLKTDNSGEVEILKRLPEVKIAFQFFLFVDLLEFPDQHGKTPEIDPGFRLIKNT